MFRIPKVIFFSIMLAYLGSPLMGIKPYSRLQIGNHSFALNSFFAFG